MQSKLFLRLVISSFLCMGFSIIGCSPDDDDESVTSSEIKEWCEMELSYELGSEINDMQRVFERTFTEQEIKQITDAALADCISNMSENPCASVAKVVTCEKQHPLTEEEEEELWDKARECREQFCTEDIEDYICDNDKINACYIAIHPCFDRKYDIEECYRDNFDAIVAYEKGRDGSKKLKEVLTQLGIDYGNYFDEDYEGEH